MTQRPDANLIRLLADGELTPEQHACWAEFERSDPQMAAEARQLIASERQLKDRIAKIMVDQCPQAPALLMARVTNELKRADAKLARKRSIFAEPFHANILAVAATLALIAGAVLFGIYGRTIDDVTRPGVVADLVSDAALYAEKEHRVCAGDSRTMVSKVVCGEMAQAEAFLADLLGGSVHVPNLSGAGYEFIGAGECGMPVPARSGHLLYRKVSNGERTPMLSIFVVRNQGQCKGKLCKDLAPGKWCCISESGVKCKQKVLRGTDGQLVYFLVCCKDEDLDQIAQHIQLN